MNPLSILKVIEAGEGLTVEFKSCFSKLNRDVYETVCAFLNRSGGTIFLGVDDNGRVHGIELDAVDQVKKDFVTAINNPQKLSPPTYLSIEIVTVVGKNILRVYVPESSQVHRCNGRIYDRNEDGDFDITDSTELVAQLYRRKQATYSENQVYSYIGLSDLRKDLIDRCRRIVRNNTQKHPWIEMDDAQLLKSAQLFQTDPLSRKSGVTLGGVMLLGTDELILQVCPAHRTDLILRKVDVDRYDDRDLVRTNLIDSYDRIQAFIQKHLPDPFFLEGVERKSLRDIIFREIASNILIHREYASGFPARLIVEYGKVITENANRPHGFGQLSLQSSVPFPKNPVIGAFFREIHRADELGSGLRKLMRYGKKYGGTDPQLIEGDNFRIVVSVPELSKRSYNSVQEFNSTPPEVVKLLRIIEGEMTRAEIMELMSLKDEKHFREKYQQIALGLGVIEMTIPDKPRSSKQKYRLSEVGKKLAYWTEKSGLASPDVALKCSPDVPPKFAPEIPPEVVKLLCVLEGEMTRAEIMEVMGLKDEKHFREKYQQIALGLGVIEMTIPDKPRSSKQKYRLSEVGKKLASWTEKSGLASPDVALKCFPDVPPKFAPETPPEVVKLLSVLEGEMTRAEIMKLMSLKDNKHFREKYQQVALSMGVIEMTIPDKPRSSKQKYRLTDIGKKLAGKP